MNNKPKIIATALAVTLVTCHMASAQVALTVGTAFDPGTLGNYALSFVGPYLLSIAAIILISSLVIGVFRKFGRFGRTLPNS